MKTMMDKLDIDSEQIDLDARKGACIRLFAFVCNWCGMVRIEGHASPTPITQATATQQARKAGWSRHQGEWYCSACQGMHVIVARKRLASIYERR